MGSEEEEDDAGDAGDATHVTRIGNRVFFYADVSVASVQVLYQRLQAATQHAHLLDLAGPPPPAQQRRRRARRTGGVLPSSAATPSTS